MLDLSRAEHHPPHPHLLRALPARRPAARRGARDPRPRACAISLAASSPPRPHADFTAPLRRRRSRSRRRSATAGPGRQAGQARQAGSEGSCASSAVSFAAAHSPRRPAATRGRRPTGCARPIFDILAHGGHGDPRAARRPRARSLRRHRRARPGGAVARRRLCPLRRGGGGGARRHPRQYRGAGPHRPHPRLPPRCHPARAGRHRGAVLAGLRRPALWQGARRAGACLGARRWLAEARRPCRPGGGGRRRDRRRFRALR